MIATVILLVVLATFIVAAFYETFSGSEEVQVPLDHERTLEEKSRAQYHITGEKTDGYY